MPSNLTMMEMYESLSEQDKALIRDREWAFDVYADCGGTKNIFWFELWQLRGMRPPQKIFVSPAQYTSLTDAVESGNFLLRRVENEVVQ